MITIGAIKEDSENISLTPSNAEKLIKNGFKVIVESNIGILANYTNNDYEKISVEIENNPEKIILKSDLVIKIKQWTIKEIAILHKLNPFNKKVYLMSSFDYKLISLTCIDILLLSNFQIIKINQNIFDADNNIFSKFTFQYLLEIGKKIRNNRNTEIQTVNLKEIKKVLDNRIEIYLQYLTSIIEKDNQKVGDFILKDLSRRKINLSDLARELISHCQNIHSAIGIIKNHVLGQYYQNF